MGLWCRVLPWLLVGALTVCSQFVAAQQEKPGEASAAEITFWNSVKDSKNPEEIKSYLEVFPNGTFALLARIRLKEFGPKGPAAGAAAKGSAASMDEATIRDVQERLYNLNYTITAINGKLTPETVEAVRALQERFGEATTGELTDGQIAKLRAMDPPKIWGAIAVSGGAVAETVWSLSSRREAEGKALLACRSRSTSQCKIFAIAGNQCGAAASWRETVNARMASIVMISRQVGLGPVQAAALANCNKDPRSQGRCDIVAKVCANGSHLTSPVK